jgi:hypothetical protein
MPVITRRTIALLAAVPLMIGATLVATPAQADPAVNLTSQQLTAAGFPKKPNTVGWGGTANLSTDTAPQWEDIIITGTAPSGTPVGQLLTMSRFVPSDTQGSGTFKELNITTTVQKGGAFSMHFQLGLPGTYGYRVGYSPGGQSTEYLAFQFQFTTTGNGKASPSAGSDKVVKMNAKQLEKAGFTRKVNTAAWGGTATISSNRVPAGAPVTIQGTAPAEVKPGQILTLNRFVPTDKYGSGSFESVPGVQTQVATDGTFQLTFEINQVGRYGYTLGTAVGQEWVGMEFQLRTT